jgi:hypothetical protein
LPQQRTEPAFISVQQQQQESNRNIHAWELSAV